MTLNQFVSIAALLGLGGIVGAASAAYAAASQIAADFASFKSAYVSYRSNKTATNEQVMDEAFDELDSAIGGFGSAYERLKRALAPRGKAS